MKLVKNLILATLLAPQVYAQTCTESLSSNLELLPDYIKGERENVTLDTSCIAHSMNVFRGWAQSFNYGEGEGFFLYCEDDTEKRQNTPQCQTPLYMNTIGNSFDLVVDCLGLDAEDLYPIISTESGFYHNAFSQTGTDIGFGQITDPAVTDVTHQWYNYMDEVKGADKKSCQKIMDFVESYNLTPVEDNLHCNLTKAPENPMLNALYTGIHYRIIKGYMNTYFSETNILSRFQEYVGPYYTKEREEKFKRILTILSYNLGHEGMKLAIDEYLLQEEFKLDELLKEKRKVSKEIAKIKFEMMRSLVGDFDLSVSYKELFGKAQFLEQKILEQRAPTKFNGDPTPKSLGEFLVSRKISYYLRALNDRMQYIAKKDKNNLCPTQNFLHLN